MEARPDGTTSVAYDYYGRLATISGTSTDPLVGGTPHTISYTYDSFDCVSTIVSDSGTAGSTLSYTYAGPLLQSVTWSGAVAGSVSRTYDPAHAMRPLSLTLAGASGSQVVNYGYNNDYLLTSAGPAAGGMSYPREVSTGLPLAGPTTTLGSLSESYGASGSPGFNAFGELLAFSCSCPSCGANSGTGYAVQYGRDSAGRIKQKTETVTGGASPGTTTTTYTYDANERLWTATTGTTTTTWVYDSNGNRTTRNGVVVATFDPQDRLLTYVSPINGASTYTYTNNGDLQTRSSPVTGQFTYTYDLFGRLIGVNAAGVQVTYVNDGVGRRVGRYVGAIGQQFLYDGDKVVAELDANGNLVSVFVYGLKPNVPDYMIRIGSNPGTYRILSDSLGSVRMVVNASTGAIAQQISYDEWGNVTSVPIDIANPTYYTWVGFQPFGYAGGLFDRATGLVHFGARDYDPDTGRWTRKDPIGFDGRDTNLYRYVDDDPINNVDTSGHGITANQSWAEAQIAIAEAGGDAFTTVVSGAVALGVLAHAVATPAISCPLPTQPYVVPALPVVWSIKKAPPRPPLSNRPYPKGDGTTAPEPDWEWKGPDAPGGNQGGWVSPDGSESLHPDLDHPPPVGPHWDWTGPGGQWRIFPDGRIVPKKKMKATWIPVDNRAREYIRSQLAWSHRLGKDVLSAVDLADGVTAALVPEQHSPDLYEFRHAVFVPNVSRDSWDVDGGHVESVPSTAESATAWVRRALESNPDRAFVSESWLLRKHTLPGALDVVHARTSTCDEFVYHWAVGGDSSDNVLSAVSAAYPVPLGYAVLSVVPDATALLGGGALGAASILSIARATEAIFVGAYDGESLLVWLRGGVELALRDEDLL